MKTGAVMVRAVKRIVADISDRSGLGNEWDAIDNDTKKEIKAAWAKIIEEEFEASADEVARYIVELGLPRGRA